MNTQRIAREAEVTCLLRGLSCPQDVIVEPGFYERVIDRIDNARSRSLSSVFHSPAATKVATVLAGVTLFVGGFLAYSDLQDPDIVIRDVYIHCFESGTIPVTGDVSQQRDAVLLNIATYGL